MDEITKFDTGNGSIEKMVYKYAENNWKVLPKGTKSDAYNFIDEINWKVMDKVFPELYETGKHVSGSKHIVCCPFHNDNNPSAFYDDTRFHCSSCDAKKLGVWRLLTEYAGYSDKDAMKIIKKAQ